VNPAGGGPIEGIRQIARALQTFDYEVHIASCDSPAAEWIQSVDLPVHALGPGKGTYGYTSKLVPWLIEHAPSYDVVIVNGIWQFNSYGTRLAMKRLGRPYVVFTHGMLDPYFRRAFPLKHIKKWLYWPWGEYRVLRDAAAVLFTCEDERVLARKSFWLYRANERVVNYGTAGPGPYEIWDHQRSAFLQAFPELKTTRNLLFLSRIHPKKACDVLIRAFACVAEQDPSLRLIMAGPDQVGWKAKLESLAESLGVADKIVWTGMLTGDAKWGAFHASELFVLPSHQENFGIVVAESLACGKPVLISKGVNIWREIEAHRVGFVGEDNEEGTANNLRCWLEMPESDRAAMSARCRQCFETNFEIGNAARSLIRVFEEIGN